MPNPAINRASTFSAIPCYVPAGVLWFTQDTDLLYVGTGISDNGGTPGVVQVGAVSIPILQSSATGVNATTATNSHYLSPIQAMLAVSISMETTGTASAGHTAITTLSWTSPVETHSQTETLALDGGSAIVVETFPILVAANTTTTVAFSYGGGATNDPYTYSVRIVSMP